MKKNFMTRVLAVAMSAAMALSMATATNLTVAEAATAKMASKSFTVRVDGKAKSYKATKATQKAYKITKAKAGNTEKATVKISSTGKSIKVTPGTKTGKTTITLTFKNRTTKATETVKFSGKVLAKKEVATTMTVAQKRADQVELVMSKDVTEAPAASAITITREDNVSVSVKAVAIKEGDAKVLVVDTYADMKDGKKYTVKCGDLTADFTATDGVVADVALDKTEIPVNKLTSVKVQALDKNGIIVHEGGISVTGDTRLSVNVEATDGYASENKVILYTAGSKAKATITYAGTYDATGAYVGEIKKEVTITAVAGLLSVDNYLMTFQPSAVTNAPAWDANSFKANTAISLGDSDSSLWFCIKDNEGDEVKDYYNYKVSSSNADVLILSEQSLDENVGVKATPVKEGTCYIVIKKDNAVVKTLPVTVRAAKKATSLTFLNSTTTVVSGTAANLTPDSTVVSFLKDQYGVAVSGVTPTYTSYVYQAPTGSTLVKDTSASGYLDINATYGTINVKKTLTTPGTYVFKIEAALPAVNTKGYAASKATGYVTVVRKDLDESATGTFGIFAKKTALNTTIDWTTASNVETQLYPVIYKGGIAAKAVTPEAVISMKVKAPTGADAYNTTGSVSGNGIHIKNLTTSSATAGAINVSAAALVNGAYEKYLTPGTYTVEFVLDKGQIGTSADKTVTSTFTVSDNQEAVTAKILSSNAENAGAKDWAQNKTKVQFFYDGVLYTGSDVNVTAANVPGLAGMPYIIGNTTDTTKIRFADVTVKVANGSQKVRVPVKLDVTLTNCPGL